MSKKDPGKFIAHVLECIELIEQYSQNKTQKEFVKSVQLQDSIIRRVEIIGEAVKSIPQDLKHKFPKIPWKEIAGMRDIIVHEYFKVDLLLTWEVTTKDIPKLKKDFINIQEQLEREKEKE